jgi:hypothetical protein
MSRLRRWLMAGTSLAGEIRRDEGGVVVIMTVVALGMFFGLAALVVDAGRLFNLHSQIQWYADHVALAAAAELDGEAGAIGRAIEAATGPGGDGPLIEDVQNFATDGAGANLQVARLVFLSDLGDDPPPGDTDRPAGDEIVCITGGADFGDCQPEDDAIARFVEVTVEPRGMAFFMLPVLRVFGVAEAAAEGAATAQATAGFTREVCNTPPLMICNPYENPNPPYGGDFTPIVGQQILAKSKGANTQWMPGDFGLLQAVEDAGAPHCSGGGADRIRCVMALVEPNTRCYGGMVDIMPGQAVSVHEGLNVRFDMWNPPLHNNRTNPAFAPSANVTKGAKWTGNNANQCQFPQNFSQDDAQLMAPPRDTCFLDGSCERFGNADWDRDAYWAANHGYLDRPKPDGYEEMTRYEIYRYEMDNDWIPNRWPDGGENGNPQCSPNSIDNPIRDRRKFYVAVINCLEHDIRGRTDDVPVVAFAEMFMTEPVGMDGASTDDIWVEMLGVAEPGGDDGVLHDFPQLYR